LFVFAPWNAWLPYSKRVPGRIGRQANYYSLALASRDRL
jgi:hypothetical protein